jgi:glycine cleavage system aminomethyltransferase T
MSDERGVPAKTEPVRARAPIMARQFGHPQRPGRPHGMPFDGARHTWMVDLDQEVGFVGKEALQRIKAEGPGASWSASRSRGRRPAPISTTR